MRTTLLLGAALLLGLAACDNSSSSSSTTTTTSGGDGGGGGGGATCAVASNFKLDVSVTAPAGAPVATCAAAETTVAFDGMVRTKDGDIYVETCGPTEACAPSSEVKISVGGAGLTSADTQTIPEGTFVHVVWTASPTPFGGTGCDNAVLLRNLPTWQGVANPTASHTSLWLFATRSAPLESVGVDADRAALKVEEEMLCETMDLEPSVSYAIKLTATDANASVEAQPSARATLTIPGGAQKGSYAVINDLVAVLGNAGFAKSYAIVRTAP